MADNVPVAGTSVDKNNNNVPTKRKKLSTDDVLQMLDTVFTDNSCDELESDDSLENESDEEPAIVRAGDICVTLPVDTETSERSDLDFSETQLESDSDYAPTRSEHDSSTNESSDEELPHPIQARAKRGRGRPRGSTSKTAQVNL